ncbi:hypothetical protein NC652_020137 [Populus alba x Populus x berolinensis]|nr:hypothetical protein NC652_020137 [Populus alba x Populus x berolinensis]
MASRSALSRLSLTATRSMEPARGATRYFSDDRGRVLSEEERAVLRFPPPRFSLPLLNGSTGSVWLLRKSRKPLLLAIDRA